MTITQAPSTGRTIPHPFTLGNFAPVRQEATSTDLGVTGTIPSELDGRFLRIGPNPVIDEAPDQFHWFTGTGMAHGLRLCDGSARWFRSRYVRSDRVADAMGWPAVEGPRHGMGDGTANTNLIQHAGGTYAIVEAGAFPVLLDDELETIARSDFGGSLTGAFSAHPKVDPATGELHAIAYYWEWDHVRHVVVGTDGRVRRSVEIPVPGKPMVHDCAITESSVLVLDLPCHFDLEMAMSGRPLPYRWDETQPARVGVLPIDGAADEIVWCEIDPCYVYHTLNAYDAGDHSVAVDVVRHSKTFATDYQAPDEGPTTLERWTIDTSSASVAQKQLSDINQEFPRVDERTVGRRHRYGYCVEVAEPLDFKGSLKFDVDTGAVQRRDFGPGRSSFEPVFVPRHEAASEDDGWVLAYVHNYNTETTDVEIWNSRDFTGDPAAVVHLGVRVPFGFHGNWAPTPA